jgi:hypothetical protein
MLERKPRTMPSHIPHIYPDTVSAGSDDSKDVKLVDKVCILCTGAQQTGGWLVFHHQLLPYVGFVARKMFG